MCIRLNILAVSDLNLFEYYSQEQSRSCFRSKSSSEESDSGSYHGSDSGESVPQVVGEEIVSDKHDLLLTCPSLTRFYSSGKEYWCSGGELVLQAMKVTQG